MYIHCTYRITIQQQRHEYVQQKLSDLLAICVISCYESSTVDAVHQMKYK